ncbi:uncharacterized protein LOC122623502 [Drosophila teissieri]|uniref:uncharacterized protein LOC122623502 n=1 Tax=Drosophila teissieri TaxID=7243 RepID=UPI001CBA2876|nr:uncharacterized protein LOC122623502 [Drosophila teissieri]XP_043658634.1 uncharacterized protein LOC122623502 [Drosophila teissieri]
MEDSEDDVVEVSCDRTMEKKVRAKLLEIRKFVPFIRRVRKDFQKTLSKVQGQRLDALVGLLERENVSMNSLNKIEGIIEKLKTRFKPRIEVDTGEIIDISDNTEYDSTASTSSGSTTQPPYQGANFLDKGGLLNRSPLSSSALTKLKPMEAARRSNGSLNLASAATKAKPATPKEQELERSSKASCSIYTKTSSVAANSNASGSLNTPKTPSSKPSDEVQLTSPEPRTSRQAVVQDMTTPTIPEPTSPAVKKLHQHSTPPGSRGVLAAMQKALMEEKKQRASAQKATTNAAPQPEVNFSRRSYTTSPQLTRRSPAKPVHADSPDFARRSTSLVQPASRQEASPRQSRKDVPISSSVQDLPASVSASTPSPANTLEEARKKLAALRDGAGTAPCMPPLSSNINDPRGRKAQNLPKTNINNDNDISLTLPPPMRTPSPIPPPPSMRPGSWAPFSNASLESGFVIQRAPRRNSVSPGDSRAFGDALAQDPGLEPRSFYDIDSREPRDPRIWKNKSAQQQQQQQHLTPQAQVPPYASDPRRATRIYSGYEESANRGQSNSNNNNHNQNVNANGNSCKSNWSGNQNGNGPNPRPFPNNQNGNEYAGGFNGSHSFRGGFRGGHSNRGFGNPGSRYERPKDVPRTYGEHRKAKARAEAEAKAKAAAELRQLEAEVMRHLEAEGKRRQLAAEKKQKSDESEAEKSTTPVTNLPELDTSYRNVTLGPLSKKLDFRIPKKTLPAAATITSTSPVNGNGDNLSCSSNSPASKSCDAKQDKDTYKNKDRHLDKTKHKDKVDKGKEKPENTLDKSEKHHKSQEKKANDKEKNKSDKKEKKRLNREHEKKSKAESSRELMDSNSVVSEDSSENTDNLENEPPPSETNSSPVPELAPSTPDSQQAQPVSEELDILAKSRKTSGTGTKSSLTSSAKAAPKRRRCTTDGGDEDTLEKPTKKNCGTWDAKPANEKSEDDTIEENKSTKKVSKEGDEKKESTEEDTELDKPPKISKIKIVLGPNAHSLVVHSDDGIKSREQKFMDNKTFDDDHDDEEVPGPSLQFLHRITKRRSSMAPTYSKPLVDKDKISSSYTYEDLPEQKRESQNARNLANMFKKTDDNCSLSTHNIITGKRRTRGCEASFNETQLSRSCFGLGQINRTRAKVSEGKATRPKTPAPAKDSMRADVNAVAPIPPPNRKRKRQTVHKESPDVQVEPKKARLEAEELKEDSDTPDERPAENNEEVSQIKEDVKATEPLPVSETETTPKPRAKPRRKRNELDKLNEDIAQMYYGEEVLRATGRRACTRRSRSPSLARSSSRHSRTSSISQGDSISTVSDCSSIFVRNTARRGKAFRASESGINRATFKATIDAKKPMLCRVRIQRCAALLEMLKDQEKKEQKKEDEREQTKPLKKKRKSNKNTITNINPEWHSKSMAVIKCVVCSTLVRRSPLCHYMMCHKEHYAARLPPDVLTELRAGRGNRPDYWISQRGVYTLHFTCPFCQKPLLLGQMALIDHLSAHMGESRFHCSRCNMPQNRLSRLQAHTATCGPGATPLSSNNGRLPMSVHVCHICQFLQYSKENMDRHLIVQHGLTKEELQGIEREELVICDSTDVPSAESNEDGSVIVRGTQDNRPKPSTSKPVKKSKQQKKANKRFINMVKKSVRLVKREREEQDEQKEAQEAQVQVQEDEGSAIKMEADLEVPELPPPPPEREPVLVVNECLMNSELDADLEEVLEQSVQNTSLMVDEKPVVLLSGCTELAEPTVSNPEPADDSSAQEEDSDSDVDVETVVASPQPQPALTATSMVAEVSLAELAGDVLDGIGSDGSDVENDDDSEQEDTNNENVDEANNKTCDDDDALTDEWVDLETAKSNSKASKSIFHVFNRFCSRLNKGPRSSKAVPSSGSQCSDGSNEDVPDPSELMPTMQPLEPEPEPEPEPQPGDLPTSTGVKSLSKRVENVAFRKSSSDDDQNQLASYYCVQPGCTFLFSDELEGLENHFALEHPLVRWSGKCGMCHQKLKATGTNLGISEELRHMRDVHMKERSTQPPQPSAEEIPAVIELQPESQPESEPDPVPVPVLCKLRVRRFTGDRLVADSQAEKSQPEEIVSADADNQRNGMLRDLLAADPRPPNQQLDFHAAGLGEFLTAKPDSTEPSAEPAEQQHVIVGYPSGLGLKISQVFSRTQISADAVLSPVVNDPLPVEASAPAAVEDNRNRFRCMANNCNFTAHKVMFVREHMKFHSFSFSSSGHLNCAYCSHVAVDVDDYLRHGVIIHDLAPRSDLESSTGAPSVSQKIRDMLNLRDSATSGRVSTAATTITAQSAINGNEPAAGGSTAVPTSLDSLSDVILGLFKSTGYSEDKLFGCPIRSCIVKLTGEQFVNHLRYHIRSTHLGSGSVRCKFCPRAMQPPALRTHLQQYHARHSIFCGICLATSVNKLIMLYHMRTVHCKAYSRSNRSIQFVPLPVKPDAAKKSVETQCFVAVLEQPFGNLQMQNFQRKLFEEMELRRSGTKTDFRSSEVHLLPTQPMFQQPLRCAECPFSSSVRTNMQVHLYEHKEENIREAYKREETLLAPTVPAGAVVAPQRPVIDLQEPSTSGQSCETPQPPQPEPVVPGIHKPIQPPFCFVPPDLRYRCGFFLCGTLCSSESALRKHMMGNHKYSEVVSCPHCNKSQGHVSVEKYADHLSMHKRYIFQCGDCSRHNSRRAIERHIQERHHKNVDLVVHRHSDTNGTTDARWLKAPKLAREALMEYTCNLCPQYFPTTVQVMAHAASVHERNYQYHCPYCAFGGNLATVLIEHILREHPERDVQPLQVYQRIVCKSKQTLGFYCTTCHKAATSYQQMAAHCEKKHMSRCQVQCPHCVFGHSLERQVALHIHETHPDETGLAVVQFERVLNEIPDSISWEMGRPIKIEPEKEKEQDNEQGVFLSLNQRRESGGRQLQEAQIVTEVVDLLDSDDETDEPSENDELKIMEFACTHCGGTNTNLSDLRTQHWARDHPEQPFYFRVQPLLLCCECKSFKGNAKALREHLLRGHAIRNIVAADIRQPSECAYCDYRYTNWQDLAQHISRLGHLPNDLKHVTNAELDALMLLSASGSGGIVNEYYQCGLCSVVMPTKATIGQHGQVEHSKPGERFCFRQLVSAVIYHCSYCIFTSTDELTTLRHMLDHYSRFLVCHFCTRSQPGGFDEYIQHCYTYHRNDMKSFRKVHTFIDLKKFLMQVHYQFQNGLIITKSSLRYTRYNTESIMRKLDNELMTKAQRPPIPRLHIRLKSTGVQLQSREQEAQVQEPVSLVRIAKRRKTLNPGELLRLSRQENEVQPQAPPTAVETAAPSTSSVAATFATAGSLINILKRRNSLVVRPATKNLDQH